MHLTGDGPWSRALRHVQRTEDVCARLNHLIDGFDNPPEQLAYWLLWAEVNAAHYRGPNRLLPTSRPLWWVEAGLPDRRHRASGGAWTAAAAAALHRMADPLPDESNASTALEWLVTANHYSDAEDLAAAVCQKLYDAYRGVAPLPFSYPINAIADQWIAERLAAWEARLAIITPGRA